MARTKDDRGVGRRGFLAAVAGLSAGAAASAVATPALAEVSQEDRRKSLYRETEHVKLFYATNRYETEQG